MAFNTENMTTDYKKLMSIPVSQRAHMAQNEMLNSILTSMTPTQVANLFPSYYKESLPSIAGFQSSVTKTTTAGDGSGYSGGTAKGGGGSGGWGGTAQPTSTLTISDMNKKLLEKGIDVNNTLQSIGSGILENSPQAKVLKGVSSEDLAKMGIQKTQDENGKTLLQVMPTQVSQMTDEQVISEFKKSIPSDTFTPRERATLDFIAKREGAKDPNIIFGDTSGPGSGKYSKLLGLDKRPLTDMSISEVFKLQGQLRELTKADRIGKTDDGRILGTSAVGTGQMIEGTLRNNLLAIGIKEEDFVKIKFDKTLQEKLTLSNFKTSGIGDPNADPSTWNKHKLGKQYESLDTSRGHSAMTGAEIGAISSASTIRPEADTQNISPEEARAKLAEAENQKRVEAGTKILYNQNASSDKGTQNQFSAVAVPPVPKDFKKLSDYYDFLQKNYPEKIDVNSPMWDTVNPKMKEVRDYLIASGAADKKGGYVNRDTLIAVDSQLRMAAKYGLTYRSVVGGGGDDEHSANHGGKGRDTNYSIDVQYFDKDGKPVHFGNLPTEVKANLMMASAAGGANRMGTAVDGYSAAFHTQADREMGNAIWGYTGNKQHSRASLEASAEGRQLAKVFDQSVGKAGQINADLLDQLGINEINKDPIIDSVSATAGTPAAVNEAEMKASAEESIPTGTSDVIPKNNNGTATTSKETAPSGASVGTPAAVNEAEMKASAEESVPTGTSDVNKNFKTGTSNAGYAEEVKMVDNETGKSLGNVSSGEAVGITKDSKLTVISEARNIASEILPKMNTNMSNPNAQTMPQNTPQTQQSRPSTMPPVNNIPDPMRLTADNSFMSSPSFDRSMSRIVQTGNKYNSRGVPWSNV